VTSGSTEPVNGAVAIRRATLTVTLTDPATGGSITTGASVSITGPSTPSADSASPYSFTNLLPGLYSITVTHSPNASTTDSITLSPGDPGARAITLNPPPPAGLTLTVQYPSGTGITDATVDIVGPGSDSHSLSSGTAGGVYHFTGLQQGTYSITITRGPNAVTHDSATLSWGNDLPKTTILNAPPPADVTVTVQNPNGTAVTNATVTANLTGGPNVACNLVSGTYRCTGLQGGGATYTITVTRSPNPVKTDTITLAWGDHGIKTIVLDAPPAPPAN
jgi:hypothetical protein